MSSITVNNAPRFVPATVSPTSDSLGAGCARVRVSGGERVLSRTGGHDPGALFLTAYRELAGLGPVSGMNDAFGWGIWKTFNVMVLTALGSGAFAVGIAAWVFRRKRLHALMRMALLTSFLAYACGLLLLGIDAGRPWNFYWIVFPWKWNMHSPLAEVAICMSIYASSRCF